MYTEPVLTMDDVNRPEAEEFVISRLIVRPELLTIAQKHITAPDVFYEYKYGVIYDALMDLTKRNADINIITLADATKDRAPIGVAELGMIVGESGYLYGIPVGEEAFESSCKIVAKAYLRREIISKMNEKQDFKDIMEFVARMEKTGVDKFFNPKEIAAQLIHKLFIAQKTSTLNYPWEAITQATGGLRRGEVVVVAGRPSAGKSTFCENIASFVAEKLERKVIFASAEMTAEMIALRIATRKTGINLFNHPDPFSEAEQQAILIAKDQIEKSGLYVHEFMSISELETIIQEKARDFDLLVVDYMQLIEPKARYRSQYEKVTYVANELTQISKKYHLPVIIAAQFNRQADKQQPTMADIKESGQIEQNADVIFSLWQHGEDPVDPQCQKVRIDILKNRNGETRGNYGDSEFFLNFRKPIFKFTTPDWKKIAPQRTV